MRLIEIPDDGIVRIPIMSGEDTVGEKRIDLSHIPTIEIEQVRHGRWEWKDFRGDGSLILCCSECLETEGARETSNYCHNCGAKMNLEE
jgi:hypothetical protein